MVNLKKCVFLLLFLSCSVSLAQDIKYVEKKEGVKLNIYKRRMFGQVKLAGVEYVDGKRNGVWVKFKLNGDVKFCGTYIKGIKIGLWYYSYLNHRCIKYDNYGKILPVKGRCNEYETQF